MFDKKPLLVKDLPFKTIKLLTNCYWKTVNNFDEYDVKSVLNEVAEQLSLNIDKLEKVDVNKEKFESELTDKYIKLERELRNNLAEEESAMIKSFNLKEEKKEEEIFKLKTKIANLQLDFDLIKKENDILEAKMDDVDELISEISEKDAKIARLEWEISEKDKKFNLLKEIYDNPRVQETKVFEPTIVEPRIIEPRMIPTVSCNQK